MPDQGRISVLQVVLILWIGRMVVSVIIPGALGLAKRDAWLTQWAVMVAQQAVLFILLALAARFPGKPLVAICRTVMGRFFGSLLGLLFLGYFFHIGAVVIRVFSDFMLSAIMPATPVSVIMLCIGLLAAYAARHGIEILGRSAEVLFPILFVGMGLILVLALEEARTSNLLPVLEHGLFPVYKSVVGAGPIFPEVVFVPTLAALIHNRQGLRRGLHLMLLAAGAMISFLNFVVIATLGEHLGTTTAHAGFEVARLISIGDIIEHIEPLYMAVVVIGYFVRVGLFLYAASFTTAELLGLGNYRPLVLPCLIIMLTQAITLWQNTGEHGVWVTLVFPPLSWIVQLLIPAFLLIVAVLRGLKADESLKRLRA